MNYPWLEQYLLHNKGSEKEFQPDWQATKYLIGGKMFGMLGGDKDGRPIVTLKLEPAHGEALRAQYKDIVPGYYMNKVHWNSLYLEGDVPDAVLKEMVDEAYGIVLRSLSKKLQKEILEG